MTVLQLAALLPAPLAYGLALLFADLRYWLDRSKFREEVSRNLQAVLGDQLNSDEHAHIMRKMYRLETCEIVDATRLSGRGDALTRLVQVRGLEHVRMALANGKGGIIASAHYGSTDCTWGLLGALGFPITVIARWAFEDDGSESPARKPERRAIRRRPLAQHVHRPNLVVERGNLRVAVQAAKVLRQNELIYLNLDALVDPADREWAIQVDFLGRQAVVMPGAVTLAQLTGAPLLIALLHRSPDWRHQVLEISPPISLDGEIVAAFQRCLAMLEAAIRRDPAQWRKWPNTRVLVRMELLSEDAIPPSRRPR